MNPIGAHLASIIGLPPQVGLFLTIIFVAFLFRRDIRERPNVTSALWIPFFWMLMTCSRGLSVWLRTFGLPIATTSLEDGTPLDACVFFILIVAGFYVLNQRRVNWSELFQKNGWLLVFLLYCFVAISWSDYPFVAFKRWIKVLGLPIMALILFTEPDFEEALMRLIKRSAYILIPCSVLVIKYYPGIAMKYDEWTGLRIVRGIAQSKNMLGCQCLLIGFFFVWHLLKVWPAWRSERTRASRDELLLTVGFLLMIAWLLKIIHSSTATVCLFVAVLVMVLTGSRFLNRTRIGTYAVLAVTTLAVAQLTFDVFGHAIEVLGKDSTLTGRTVLWESLLGFHTNPVVGVGFESFWLGDRLVELKEGRSFQPNEAHNGYLETYLNLGSLGLLLLAAVIFQAYGKIRRDVVIDIRWGRFELGLLVAIILYNWTEVTFRGPSAVWLMFYVIALDYPKWGPASETVDIAVCEEERAPGMARSVVENWSLSQP